MKQALYTITALSILTYSCKRVQSSDLKDTVPYHQWYEVKYDKVADSTLATALFRMNNATSSRIELTGGSSISANGKKASSSQFLAGIYSWHVKGQPDFNFLLTKESGKTFANNVIRIQALDADFPSSFPSVISKSTETKFNWVGPALAFEEILYVTVAGVKASDPVQTESKTNTFTGQTITIHISDLTDIKPGPITIKMERLLNRSLDAEDGSAGGKKVVSVITYKKITLNP